MIHPLQSGIGRAALRAALGLLVTAMLAGPTARAQVMEGDVHVVVTDADGQPVADAEVEASSRNPVFSAMQRTGSDGEVEFTRLPRGVYSIVVRAAGFREAAQLVEVETPVPQTIMFKLEVGTVVTQINVSDEAPLMPRDQPTVVTQIERQQLDKALGTTLGRSTIDAITTTPGWLLEANAVLHPRGSEYDTQYVIDGMPLYDNRSIAFAPPFENEEFEGVNAMLGGIPAEYGRNLGGVISLDTRRIENRGYNWDVNTQTGSFNNRQGAITYQKRLNRSAFLIGVHGGLTDRYLDPPSLRNFTNHGSLGGMNARFEQDLTPVDRLTVYIRSNRTNFLVPNDLPQQAAGQRQDRRSSETAGQVHYQHAFGDTALATLRGMVRDLSSLLWSNPLATPAWVNQDRGFREGALIGNVTVEHGEAHTFKFGGDVRVSDVREMFQITDPQKLPAVDINFQKTQRMTMSSLYAQDHLEFGNFSANVGLRFDQYGFLIHDTAWSPRVAMGYYVPKLDVLLRASYDRVFMPPPIENLLFSSLVPGLGVSGVEGAIPVPAARANFFEVGFRKPLGNRVRLDVTHYWRTFRNYIDDDVFLNTGLGFPITFDTARIQGTDVRLDMPLWRDFTATASWSNMHGIAGSPVTGGLFLRGGDAEELRDVVTHFPITQDQRNTVAAQVRYQPHERYWVSVGTRYGSGLPVQLEGVDTDNDNGSNGADLDGDTDDTGGGAIPAAVLKKVNFSRGRVRPNYNLNVSTGVLVWQQEARSATLQFDLRNLTNRLNVINFSGVFSGTALAPGRQYTVQLKLRF